jgi:hypothetical protein
MAAKSGEDERRRYALEHAARIEQNLARVRIETASDPPAGLAIALDGQLLGAPTLATAVPVDPGAHVLEASAPGHRRWSTKASVPAGPSTTVLRVPVLELAAVRPSPPARAAERSGAPQRSVGFVLLGVAAIAVGVGTFAGIRAIVKKNDSDEHCVDTSCDETGLSMREASDSAATLANVAFAAAAVSVGLGVALIVTAPATGPAKSAGFVLTRAW